MKKKQKIGVVLAGGGAKGAYEVGFLRALSEYGIEPDAIAGTSIGALNGCLYASLKSTQDAYETLKKVWNRLKKESPLKIDKLDTLLHLTDLISFLLQKKDLLSSTSISPKNKGILQTNPILEILQKYTSIQKIKKGLPFYISMSEANDTFEDLLHLVDLNKILSLKKIKTQYLKIQEVEDENIYKCILASAALPFLFDAQEIGGKIYRDGCLGVNYDASANAPVLPLIQKEKCDVIFVCHLDDKISFAEQYKNYKKVKIVEVTPKKDTFTSSLDPLRFNREKINFWMKGGYQDSKKVLKAFKENKDIENLKATKQDTKDILEKIAIQGLKALMTKQDFKE